MWLYRQEPIKVSYHPTEFGVHMHSESGDMFLVCQVYRRDDVTSTCMISLIWVNPSIYTYLLNLVVKGLMEMKIPLLYQFLHE